MHGFDPWVRKIPWRRAWQFTCILAWRIPWTEEPGGLQSMKSQSQTRLSEHSSPLYSCYYVYFLPHPLLSLGFKLPRSGPLLSLLLAPMAEVLKIQENWSKTVCWITWVFNSDSSIVGQFWSWHISSLTHSHCWDGLPRKQQRPCKSPWRSDLPRDFWNNFTQNKK